MFANVNLDMAVQIADAVGANPPMHSGSDVTKASPALSQENTAKKPDTRKVGVIASHLGDSVELLQVVYAMKSAGLKPEIISNKLGSLGELEVGHTFTTADPVLFDAVYVASINDDKAFMKQTGRYLTETYNHFKALGASPAAGDMLLGMEGPGVVTDNENDPVNGFIGAVTAHRHWRRIV